MTEKGNYTLVLLKPTARQRKLVGKIIGRFERAGLKIERMELKQYSREQFEDLYREHRDKPFYEEIVSWMSSEPIVALILSGEEGIVKKVRTLVGATDPVEAAAGTIRGDFDTSITPDNLVHASDSKESAEREARIFFPDY